MTTEEAIKYLIPPTPSSNHSDDYIEYRKQKEVYNLAIEVLEMKGAKNGNTEKN